MRAAFEAASVISEDTDAPQASLSGLASAPAA